jgi:hypothetical protein
LKTLGLAGASAAWFGEVVSESVVGIYLLSE